MRWANVIAFWVGSLWLGGCLALGVAAMILFPYARDGALEIDALQLGEIFGHMFDAWTRIGLAALGVMVLARIVAWALLARRGRFRVVQIISVLLLAVLIVSTLATARATFAASDAYQAMDSAQDDESERKAYAEFSAAHVAARKRSDGMVLALFLVVGGLGIGLARRDPQGASAPA